MAKFFSLFPKIAYDISGKQLKTFNEVTDIFLRFRVIQSVLNNISAYYEYIIREGDTPEILAEKVYGDPETHWIILLSNNIIDAQYDWPLNSKDFKNYIINKYGSIENAKTQIHHYEKVIERTESFSGIVTESKFIVNQTKIATNVASVVENLPYEYYEEPDNIEQYETYGQALPETQSVTVTNMGYASKNSSSTLVNSGRSVTEVVNRNAVSFYDYEVSLNESKRTIKIIKPEYLSQIVTEFDELTRNNKTPYIRRLIV